MKKKQQQLIIKGNSLDFFWIRKIRNWEFVELCGEQLNTTYI